MMKRNLRQTRPACGIVKESLYLALSAALLLLPFPAFAAPQGGKVVRGAADIVQSGNTTNINQSTHKATINWNKFSIARNETVNFNQPNSSSMTLNRVIGNERSVIEGALNANGKVYLINSNGVVFGQGSSVNVGGLVASTLDITDDDFMKGRYVFQGGGKGTGQVVNMGTIKAVGDGNGGGYVALLGEQVRNEGVIIAERGTVAMNGATKATLNFNGDSLVSVSLDEGALNALVENKKAIYADGGKVILTAKAADEVLGAQVNTDGIVQARTLADLTGGAETGGTKGSIEIYAYNGTANIAGTLDASAPNGGDGGFIETSGKKVKVADSAKITTKSEKGKTGTWLIDPYDILIAASGGDMTGSYISDTLANTDVTLQADNDITIDDIISWATTSTLLLKAGHDININNAINVQGAGTLDMRYGNDYHIRTRASYSGVETDANGNTVNGDVYDKDGNLAGTGPVAKKDTSGGVYGSISFNDSDRGGSLYIGQGSEQGDKYTLIYDMTGLAGISGIAGKYALARNINAGGTTYASSPVSSLNGTFTGLGHTIDKLTINSATAYNTGLFSSTVRGSAIRDLGLTDVDIIANYYIGSLVGTSSDIAISNVYATGKVTGTGWGDNVGGLIGYGQYAIITISDSFTDMSVIGTYNVGGFVGQSFGGSMTILNSHTWGDITATGTGTAGGFIGLKANTGTLTIRNSYATGNIISTSGTAGNLGGLVGNDASENGLIENAFATGDIVGSGGGLIGTARGTILNVYATGNVSNGGGGLIGSMQGGDLSNAFATGNVSGTGYLGGLIGTLNGGAIDNVYATGDVTGSGDVVGGLVGYAPGGTITNSYATGDVTSSGRDVGGIMGRGRVTISDSWASGNVRGSDYTGGFIGNMQGGSISNSYATGSVMSDGAAGGFIGYASTGTVTGSYATGSVTGSYAGGFIGGTNTISISDSYATGSVTANTAGGFIGAARSGDSYDGAYITNSYYASDENPGLGMAGSDVGVTLDGSGSLTAAQLADAGVRNAITTGGDVQTAVQNYEIRQENIRQQIRQEQLRQEQMRQEQIQQEQIRQDTITNVTTFTQRQPETIKNTAENALQATAEASGFATAAVSLENAIVDYTSSLAGGASGPAYSANIKTVTADGVTYVVDDEESRNKVE
jgi:filamentous hemagglutinin family protein